MIYYRKHAKLLEKAVAIFGDIIDNAYLSTEYRCIHINDVISDKVLIRELSRYMQVDSDDMTIMDFPPEFILKFKNGNQVKFTCSEWGDASKVRMDDTTNFMEI